MIKFKCERKWLRATYTISDYSYFDDQNPQAGWQWLCNILELQVGNNTPDEEAISYGLYTFTLSMSENPNIPYVCPLLQDVPRRTGIRQHIGDFPRDTKGCQLIGMNTIKGRLTDSETTFNDKYIPLLKASGQTSWQLLIC